MGAVWLAPERTGSSGFKLIDDLIAFPRVSKPQGFASKVGLFSDF